MILLQNCSDDDDVQDVIDNLEGGLISVNTEKFCLTEPNYKGDDVYAYRLDSILNEPSLEIGGHPFMGDQDFIVDLIARTGEIENGYYALNHAMNKYAGVIYNPDTTKNQEYVSIPNQTGQVKLEWLEYSSVDSSVISAKVTFTEVKLAYATDTICVTGLALFN